MIDRLRTWNVFSNSSPIEGIVEAIRTYHSKDKKISLYVFGDEFTGSSIDSVVKGVRYHQSRGCDRRAPRAHSRYRLLQCGQMHAQYTSICFTTLMRILCQRNGGSFVGLDDPERGGPEFSIGDNATPGLHRRHRLPAP